ncbi:hypothetical protein [Sorangium sp. So ce1097]|uniref:hypothetical protein n=1 Tax=Sorangium sp. So ce1097 TaxID=3133330 RepID=UPI003F60767D
MSKRARRRASERISTLLAARVTVAHRLGIEVQRAELHDADGCIVGGEIKLAPRESQRCQHLAVHCAGFLLAIRGKDGPQFAWNPAKEDYERFQNLGATFEEFTAAMRLAEAALAASQWEIGRVEMSLFFGHFLHGPFSDADICQNICDWGRQDHRRHDHRCLLLGATSYSKPEQTT